MTATATASESESAVRRSGLGRGHRPMGWESVVARRETAAAAGVRKEGAPILGVWPCLWREVIVSDCEARWLRIGRPCRSRRLVGISCESGARVS